MPAPAESDWHGPAVDVYFVPAHLNLFPAGDGQCGGKHAGAVIMKRKYILSAIVIAVLIGAAVYFYGGGQAPRGQPPLERLTAQNVSAVKNAFNAAKADVRVLLLLSPT